MTELPAAVARRYRRGMSAYPMTRRLRAALIAAIAAVLVGLTGCNDSAPTDGGTQQEDSGGY
jgi:hypothetical protein